MGITLLENLQVGFLLGGDVGLNVGFKVGVTLVTNEGVSEFGFALLGFLVGGAVGVRVGEPNVGGRGIIKGPLKKFPGSYLAFTFISLARFTPK